MKQRVGKGAKNLDDLAKRMLKKARFKGFKIKRKGKWFQLYGSVNPWVLLASGKIEEVEAKGGVEVGQQGKFTLKGSDETVDGILVGINKGAGNSSKSRFVKSLDDGATNADDFLKLTDDSARKKIIDGVNNFDYAATVKAHGKEVADVMKNRGHLAKNIGKEGAGEFD